MADNVRDIFSTQRAEFDRARRNGNDGGPIDSGGGPPHDGGMEERVKKLEQLADKLVERTVNIERDVAVMRSNYATGKDVADAKSSIIMWVVGAIFVAQLLPMVKDFMQPTTTPTTSTLPSTPAAAAALPTK